MKEYLLDHKEYVKQVRMCASIADGCTPDAVRDVLMDLLTVRYDYKAEYFIVPENLMQKLAIINLCDMALIQYRDTRGEIDYAYLGHDSEAILDSILARIDNI